MNESWYICKQRKVVVSRNLVRTRRDSLDKKIPG